MKFESRQEVEQYLSGEKVECLLCGKEFFRCGRHLRLAHAITASEYKRRYGIPQTWGLSGIISKKKAADSAKRQWERDGAPPRWDLGGHHANARPAPLWCVEEFTEKYARVLSYQEAYDSAVADFCAARNAK